MVICAANGGENYINHGRMDLAEQFVCEDVVE